MGRYVAFMLLILCLSGCADKQPVKQISTQLPFKAIGVFPSKDSVVPAKVVMLDTCPAPEVITVSADPLPSTAAPDMFSLNMTTYGAEQGLYSTMNTIKKDRVGNFWFGTSGGGVIRYDGKTATNFTTAQGLPSNNIKNIVQDKKGNFWFGSFGGGTCYYDGKSFTKITRAQGLASNNVRGIIIDSAGNIWFATYGGGISVYNGRSFTNLTVKNGLMSDNVLSILQSRDGTIWCGTDSGVSKCNPSVALSGAKAFTNYTTANGLASNVVLNITEDRKGNLWFSTGGGASCLPVGNNVPSAHLFRAYTMAHGLPTGTVNDIFEDRKGTLWFCTEGGGICCCNPSSAAPGTGSDTTAPVFTVYNADQGLCNNSVKCVEEDESGQLWFGTNGGGISRFDGESFKTSTGPRGTPKSTITCVRGDKTGKIWFGGEGKRIFSYDGKYLRNYNTMNALPGSIFTSMLEDKKGYMWFGTGNGLCKCTKQYADGHEMQFTNYSTAQGMFNIRIWCITEDTSGRIWVATSGGILCFDGKSFTAYTTAQGLGNNTVWSAFCDKSGNLWFGTFGGGVSRFVEHPADGGPARFVSYTTAQGLASDNVKSIAQDKSGNLWMGTGGGGVSRYDGNSFTNYTTVNGLSNNIVVTISEDKSGKIWFGTNEGFTVVKGYRRSGDTQSKATTDAAALLPPDNNKSNEDLAASYTPVLEKYNFKNGFPVKDLNTSSMFMDTAGIVWAGSADKLVRFDYNKLNKNTEAPHVFINAVKIGGESICWYGLKKNKVAQQTGAAPQAKKSARDIADSLAILNEELSTMGDVLTPQKRDNMYRKYADLKFDSVASYYPLPVNLVLPYKNNNITFDFAAIELARPYLVKYQYMLEGYDKDWNPVTDRSNASFGNIREGNYTFKLRALSPGGKWSEPATFSFEVLPPAYRAWWANVLYIFVVTCGIYLIVHYRTGILKKENERLETIVSERTAQIEQEKAAAQIQASDLQKLNLFKDKTFSILSHDLRGPINTSATVIAMLDDDDISIEEFKSLKEGMIKQLAATGVLLDNLLKWAKGSMEGSIEPKPEKVNLYEVANRNLTLFKESLRVKSITVNNNVPQHVTAFCDAEHIDIVIRNLLANAIKFTGKNGIIDVNATIKNGNIRLTVADSGVGMSKEQVDRLFKPIINNTTYGTAGEKGTGLGLLLSYDFIKANKGNIEVLSELGKGTTFTVVVPVG